MALTDIVFNQGESASFLIPAGQVFTPLYAEGTSYTRPVGVVVSDAGNTATQFKTNLSSTTTDAYKDSMILFITGALKDQVKSKVSGYNGSTKIITMSNGFSQAPSAGDKFVVVGF